MLLARWVERLPLELDRIAPRGQHIGPPIADTLLLSALDTQSLPGQVPLGLAGDPAVRVGCIVRDTAKS
jgi:hypothetical protein